MPTDPARVAGQAPWTRDLARDVFPDPVTPFAWTLLAAPAETALRGAWARLAAALPPGPLWRLEGGRAWLSAAAAMALPSATGSALWLAGARPPAPAGLMARLQAGAAQRKAGAEAEAALARTAPVRERTLAWLARAHGLRWGQADLLQVMEELEPRAAEALEAYFLARAALPAALAAVDHALAGAAGGDQALSLYAGLAGAPTTELIAAVLSGDPRRIAPCGHRGPGEMRPDAARWGDSPGMAQVAAATQRLREPAQVAARRDEAERALLARLEPSRGRAFAAALAGGRAALTAADGAWDAVTAVMAAAQLWLSHAAVEALGAGLIAAPGQAVYLALEELKQVATGEWHGGRSGAVQEEMARRAAGLASPGGAASPAVPAVGVGAGAGEGPVHAPAAPQPVPPPGPAPGSVWCAEAADAGCAPFWPAAAAVVAWGGDPYAPGMVAARLAGVPAVSGGPALSGGRARVDAARGEVAAA